MMPSSAPLSSDDLTARAEALFAASVALKQRLLADGGLRPLAAMAALCAEKIAAGGKLLFCGNGGSAADAQHLAAELTIRLRSSVNRDAIAALTLAGDSSALTACGNDYGFDLIFSRMLQALGRPGDVLIGITTSGKSPNVLNAFETAQRMGIPCLGFLGGTGGPAAELCDLSFIPPSSETGRVQEAHITAGHALMEMIEDLLLQQGVIRRI